MKANKEDLRNLAIGNISVDVNNNMDAKMTVNVFNMCKSPTMMSLKIRT